MEDVDPIPTYYASVSRAHEGRHGVLPRSAHEPDGGAEVLHDQRRVRRLRGRRSRDRCGAGKLADITVLSKDIMTIPEDQIPSAKVLYTIVGGKVQYTAPR